MNMMVAYRKVAVSNGTTHLKDDTISDRKPMSLLYHTDIISLLLCSGKLLHS